MRPLQNLLYVSLSFAQAASILGDAIAYTFPDPDHSVGESRWLTFGMSGMGRVLVVIYTERRSKVRLISARVATKHERKIYEED